MIDTNSHPLISIITIVYNGKISLEKTINSVISQTYKNIEYIVIDGGSTDGTIDIIKKYEDSINLWISEPDKGVYDAMNKGLKYASGEWINFLNAEDTFVSKNTLDYVFNNRESSRYKLIYGDWINVNNKGLNFYAKSLSFLTHEHLRSKFQLNHQSLFVKNIKIPNFDLTYKIKADYQWVIDIVLELNDEDILYIPEALVNYDCDGLSSTNLLHNLKEYVYLTKRNFGLFQVVKNCKIYIMYLVRYFISIIRN